MTPPVLIVGGGLAGLTAARLLHRSGIGFRLLEARDRLGGRILSAGADGNPSADGFDLGPSWFWPAAQPAMAALVADLGLAAFPQHAAGDFVYQAASNQPPQRFPGGQDGWPSMRLAGGTGALTAALAAGLPEGSVVTSARVTRIALEAGGLDVTYEGPASETHRVGTQYVILAAPPRLLEATVTFDPALDLSTARRWRETPTWMAPQAKVFACYDRPFWRDAGLSGAARSTVGPLVEIHDATSASGQAALFGFVGVPAEHRQAAGREAVVDASVRQLAALFGPEAARPIATLYKDWSADPLTATAADRTAGGHPEPDPRPWIGGPWQGRILLAGSETSTTEPGYLAGAVQAAERAVADLLRTMREPDAAAMGITPAP